MTPLYEAMIYAVHSGLETAKDELIVTNTTTVENFQETPENKEVCTRIFNYALSKMKYELSHNQVCNGINLFLKSYQKREVDGNEDTRQPIGLPDPGRDNAAGPGIARPDTV